MLHVSCFALQIGWPAGKYPFTQAFGTSYMFPVSSFLQGSLEKKMDLGSLEPTNHLLQAGALTPTLQGFAGYN